MVSYSDSIYIQIELAIVFIIGVYFGEGANVLLLQNWSGNSDEWIVFRNRIKYAV